MIINIRGTSGSGKTTIAREIMDCYEKGKPQYVTGRSRPLCYIFERKRESYVGRPLVVLGSYENVCGGADGISNRDQLFAIVRYWDGRNCDVLFEGLLYSEEFARTARLHADGRKLLVVGLTTTVDVCLERVNNRRRERKPDAEDVNPDNTTRRVGVIARAIERLEEVGVRAVCTDATQAALLIKKELGLALPE